MMKSLLLAVAAFAMVACASAQPTTSTAALQQKVLAAEVAYEVPLAVAVAYNKRPRCTVPKTITLCSEQNVVVELRRANRAVRTAFDAAMDLASVPGVTDSAVTAAIAVATSAIGPLQSIIDQYAK